MNEKILKEAAQALYDVVGIVSPNSNFLIRKAARVLITPQFHDSEITVNMLKAEYVALCSEKLDMENTDGR
ncbi:MAG: hypothetical protein JJU29_01905 [Verrucomicrobia bacterium]|nr:hypothetical protein [Verrucomicrobiota bacterium]MCH8510988.1 hypothetical protein [Kiritimatiellia bacterium]